MTTALLTQNGVIVGRVTFGQRWDVGDQPPNGYLDWDEWAGVQHKGGLRQVHCPECVTYKYPQELSHEIVTMTCYRLNRKREQIPVTLMSRRCNACVSRRTNREAKS